MEFLGRDDTEMSNENLSAAMDAGDDEEKLDNAIKKRVMQNSPAKKPKPVKRHEKNLPSATETRSQCPKRMVEMEDPLERK